MKRMFYNDDGYHCICSYRGELRREMAYDIVDTLIGTPITSLVLCVNDAYFAIFPSQLNPMVGWRDVPSFHTLPNYRRQKHFFDQVRQKGWDIPKMVMERALKKGFEFIPSMRMQDAHFAQKVPPQEHPLTGKFWLEHSDLAIEPGKKWDPADWRPHMLDFRHDVVRQHILDSAFEVIDRYGQDGFEMDWTRHFVFFKPGQGQPELLTDMVQKVRTRLDERGKKKGKRLPLIVRVAPSIEESLSYGLDVRTWAQEGLVDYIVPSSPSRYILLDMPIAEWMDMVAGTGIEIHPSPDSACWLGDGQATPEMYRAAASNFYFEGAHGFYLFNMFCRGYPLTDDAYVIMRDVSDPDALSRRNKVFMPSIIWQKDVDQLPVELADPKRPAEIKVFVGDNLAEAKRDGTLQSVILRLRADRLAPEDRLAVGLNGKMLDLTGAQVDLFDDADRGKITQWRTQTLAQWELANVRGPFAWITIDLRDNLPKRGVNTFTVCTKSAPQADREFKMNLIDVQVEVKYDYCGSADMT